jgi:hypothetical protein
MTKQKLKQNYENACNAYLKAFCEKHEYDFEDAKNSWVGNNVGGIVDVADCYMDMEAIITDIDTDAPEHEFLKWYDYCLELSMLGVTGIPNYSSWLKGCPIKTQAEIEEIRQVKNRADKAREQLEELLKNNTKNNF